MHVKTLKKEIVLLEGMFLTIYFSSVKGMHCEKHNVCFYGSFVFLKQLPSYFNFFLWYIAMGITQKKFKKQKIVQVFIFAKA